MLRCRLLATVVVLAAVVCAPSANAADAGDSERSGISLTPASMILPAKPGSTSTAAFEVRNTTQAPVRIETSAMQARGSSTGRSLVEVDTTASKDATRNGSSWLTFPKRTFTLAAGARTTVRIRVSVPEDARPGVHGVIAMFSVPTTKPGASGAGVQGKAGIGAALLLEVPGAAKAAARLVSSHGPSVIRSGKSGTFRARVENTGDTLLRFDSEVRMDGIVGATRVLDADVQLALPGGQRSFRFRYDDPPLFGRYTPQLTVVGGEGSDVRVSTDLDAVWVLPPWWLVGALVAAIVLAIVGIRARRRART